MLSPLAYAMLGVIAEWSCRSGYGGYIASWHIVEAIPEAQGLNVVCSNDHPANAALLELQRSGLVEELPDLPLRYRLLTSPTPIR